MLWTAPAPGPLAQTPRPAGRIVSPHLERLRAAASLIGDRSSVVRQSLLHEFRRAGAMARPLLRRALANDDATVRAHARSLLDTLESEDVLRRLLRHVSRDVIDLEQALFLLSRLDRAHFDSRPYVRAIDAMGKEVRRRSTHCGDDLERGKILVEYLGTELGYRGDMDTYPQPENVFLHRTIERKVGLPLTLCALYSFVGRRAGIRTGLVPLPGHVMLRLYGSSKNLIVDPFHGGEARCQESLMAYLREHGLKFRPVWFQDACENRLLRRQIANLRNAYMAVSRHGRARRLVPLIDHLDHQLGL